jgi:hypothetical protein
VSVASLKPSSFDGIVVAESQFPVPRAGMKGGKGAGRSPWQEKTVAGWVVVAILLYRRYYIILCQDSVKTLGVVRARGLQLVSEP